MRKTLFLAIVLLSFGKVNCQVNNLQDLIQICEYSVDGLMLNLQGIWELKQPVEKTSADKKSVIGTYGYEFASKNQTIERVITSSLTMDYTSERTNFFCNDQELLKRITKNLPYNGYELKQNKPNKKVYHDGNNMIAILTQSNDDVTLKKGYYMISVFIH